MQLKSPPPGPRYDALIQLLRTAETLWNASRAFFSRWDLGPSQFNLLHLLFHNPDGCTQSELGRELIMHRSNVTGLIDRLEKRGLVRRADNVVDRRAWRVTLTAAGQKLVRDILPHYHRAAEAVWGRVSARRARALVAELEQVSANAGAIATRTAGKPNQP